MRKHGTHAACVAAGLAAFAGMATGAATRNGPTGPAQDGGLSTRQPARHELAFTGGRVFHATDNPVIDQRLIVVPGSSTRVMLWSERLPDGRMQSYEAISLGGGELLGEVRELDNTIRVRYQNFDPARAVPAVEPALAAGPESTLHLVQFVCTPLDEFRAGVEALGGELVRFMAENGYIVRMPAGAAAQVAALPYVRWVGPFHTAYKFEPYVLEALRGGALDAGAQDYSIEVFRLGLEEQRVVAGRIAAVGGVVRYLQDNLYRMEATLTGPQLLSVARMNEVHFIGQPGGEPEADMDIVRSIGGANFIETTLSFTGQGVRAEVFDSELLTTHQEFSTITPNIHSPQTFVTGDEFHGTSVFSISFARGAQAIARGLLPSSAEQNFYRAGNSIMFGGADKTRDQIAADLVAPGGSFRSVYQTSSIGSTRNLVYNAISQEMDTILFNRNILHCQSQSNAGATAQPRNSRPQAWAKNILSGGAVNHQNTAGRADDTWLGPTGGTSTGPAEDGRIKPDLCFFYDMTRAATRTSTTSYTEFGGTSGATPSVCGYIGLFHQMWHEGVWAGRGGGSEVFTSRPQHQLAKAALISSAFRYTWGAGGPNNDLTRFVQGFGMPDLQALYNLRNKTVINNEEDSLNQGQTKTYRIAVAPGEAALNVVMCYLDPPGTTSSSQHRINDLTLKVTEPNGTTVRFGNNGLTAGNFNTTGGGANTKDTVECVFVQNPVAGVWTVEVTATQVTQDARPETPGVNADFALWLTGGVVDAGGAPCLATAAPNNGLSNAGAGVFMDLEALGRTLEVTGLTCGTTAPAGNVTVEIRVRNGSYVGFDGSGAGWTLWGTFPAVSDGSNFTVDLSGSPLRITAGTTTGVYLVNTSAGGVRYTGTGTTPPQTTWADSELRLFSDVSRSALFGGTRFQPRTFSGEVCYEVVPGCPGLEFDPLLTWVSRTGVGLGRSAYFRANETIRVTGASFFADMPAGTYQCQIYRGAGEFAAPGPLLHTVNFLSLGAGETWRTVLFPFTLTGGQEYILHFRHATAGTQVATSYQRTDPLWGNAPGEDLNQGPVTILDGREGYNAENHSNSAFPRMRLLACSDRNFVIDFDYLPGADGRLHTADDPPVVAPTTFGAQTTQLTGQYAGPGVLFTPDPATNDKNEILNNNTFAVPPEVSEPNLLASNAAATIDARFTRTVWEVAALIGISSGVDRLEAFDQNGVSIASVAGDDAEVRIKSPPGRRIARIQVRNEAGSTTPAIDNLYVRVGPDLCPCACDFDVSTGPNVCDIFDFLEFQNRFTGTDPCACDMDVSTGPGVCDIFDFLEFQNRYTAGCP